MSQRADSCSCELGSHFSHVHFPFKNMLQTVRVGLQRPEPCPYEGNCRGFQQNATGLPYCVDFTGVRPPNMLMNESYSCRYADQNFAVWPPVEQRGVLVATRVTTSSEQLPNGCASTGGSLPVPDCYLWQTLYNTTYYIAQLEYFTAFVDHTMTAASIGNSNDVLSSTEQ